MGRVMDKADVIVTISRSLSGLVTPSLVRDCLNYTVDVMMAVKEIGLLTGATQDEILAQFGQEWPALEEAERLLWIARAGGGLPGQRAPIGFLSTTDVRSQKGGE